MLGPTFCLSQFQVDQTDDESDDSRCVLTLVGHVDLFVLDAPNALFCSCFFFFFGFAAPFACPATVVGIVTAITTSSNTVVTMVVVTKAVATKVVAKSAVVQSIAARQTCLGTFLLFSWRHEVSRWGTCL